MGLRTILVCNRCGGEQDGEKAASLMLSLDEPKKQRVVWQLCAKCLPHVVDYVNTPPEPEPPAEAETQPPAEAEPA